MSNLTTKQKIILGIVICTMLIVIGIYGYISLNEKDELDISENLNDLQGENYQNNEQVNSENITNSKNEEGTSSENNEQNSRTRQFKY